jgi:hypothetical protein
MSDYTIQHLAHDGMWYTDAYSRLRTYDNAADVESTARWLSELDVYKDTPIRTLYGDSLTPVHVYYNGDEVTP